MLKKVIVSELTKHQNDKENVALLSGYFHFSKFQKTTFPPFFLTKYQSLKKNVNE